MSHGSMLVDNLVPEWSQRFTVYFEDRRPPQSYGTMELAQNCVDYWAKQGDKAQIKDESAMIRIKDGDRLI